jgi:FixJ family two-component response regulator
MDGAPEALHPEIMRSRQQGGAADRPLIALVDDDESVRESLPDLLREFGFSARAFSSGEEFLQSDAVRQSKCLVLDVAMPGMNGLDVQQELARRGLAIPIIFITGHKDEDIRARAMGQGAAGFLHKPFSDSALLEALRKAVPGDRGRP